MPVFFFFYPFKTVSLATWGWVAKQLGAWGFSKKKKLKNLQWLTKFQTIFSAVIQNDGSLSCKTLELLLVTWGNCVTWGASRLSFSCDRSEHVATAAVEITEEEEEEEKHIHSEQRLEILNTTWLTKHTKTLGRNVEKYFNNAMCDLFCIFLPWASWIRSKTSLWSQEEVQLPSLNLLMTCMNENLHKHLIKFTHFYLIIFVIAVVP